MDQVLFVLSRIEKNVAETRNEIHLLETKIENAQGQLLVRALLIGSGAGFLSGGLASILVRISS